MKGNFGANGNRSVRVVTERVLEFPSHFRERGEIKTFGTSWLSDPTQLPAGCIPTSEPAPEILTYGVLSYVQKLEQGRLQTTHVCRRPGQGPYSRSHHAALAAQPLIASTNGAARLPAPHFEIHLPPKMPALTSLGLLEVTAL